MDFFNTLKQDASEKYQQMAEGSFKSPISVIKPADASQFLSKNDAFNKRIETEAYNIKNAFSTIKQNRQCRVEQETQRRKNAEAERQRRLKEEQEERDRKAREIRRQEEARKEKRNKIIIWTIIIALIAGAIFGIVAWAKSCSARREQEAIEREQADLRNYGVSNIHITVTSLEDNGYSGYYYITKIKLTVKNDCKVGLDYLAGSMKVEAADTHDTLWSGTYTLSGNVPSDGGTGKWNLELKNSQENTFSGYTLESLDIYFKIEQADFVDNTRKTYSNAEYIKVHEGNATYRETTYQNAVNLYNAGKYTQAQNLFDSLGDYKDSADYSSLCSKKAYTLEAEQELHERVGNDAIIPDDCIIDYYYTTTYIEKTHQYANGIRIWFIVPSSETSTYKSKFKTKLLNNGFTEIETDIFSKGSTKIAIYDVGYDSYASSYSMGYEAWQAS